GTHCEGRKNSVAGARGDRHTDAGWSNGTTQPANDVKCRDYCQRTKNHRSRGLAYQQTGWSKPCAVGHERDRAESGSAPVEYGREDGITKIVESGVGDK